MRFVVTGYNSGIGKYISERLLDDGHEIWGIGRSPATWSHTALRSSRGDVGDWKATQSIFAEIARNWTGLDGLICGAGSQGAIGPAMEVDPLHWAQTMSGNVAGTYFPIRAAFPLLLKTGNRAKVICFSGGGATGPRKRFSAYGVAKAAIVRLVETLADEWKDGGLAIDINSIAPGAIHTRLTEEVLALGPKVVGQMEYDQAKQIMTTGGGSLQKVSELVQFLISKESDQISGRLLAAQWDPWQDSAKLRAILSSPDAYTLRRIAPES